MSSATEWSVGLETPAAARYLHIVRLTAAGAAAEAGLSADEVEDVKIAVDELCSIVMDAAADSERLELRFLAKAGRLVVEATGPADGALEVDELARAILDATLDHLELGDEAPGGGFRFTKNRSGH